MSSQLALQSVIEIVLPAVEISARSPDKQSKFSCGAQIAELIIIYFGAHAGVLNMHRVTLKIL